MKKLTFLSLILMGILFVACGSNPIQKAYDMTQKGEEASKVANCLIDNKINFEKLSTDEFAQLSYVLMYISAKGFVEKDFTEKVDETKLSQLAMEASKAIEKLPPEKQLEFQKKSMDYIHLDKK